MRVTVHQQADASSGLPKERDRTLERVYGLKIELDFGEPNSTDRIEIALGGAFYRIEPRNGQLEISIVGVPVPEIVVHPRSPRSVRVAGVQQPADVLS